MDNYKCLLRCLQYVVNTKDQCVRLKPEHMKLMGHSDASYNSNKMDSRSQLDTVLFLVNMDIFLPIQLSKIVCLPRHMKLIELTFKFFPDILNSEIN